MITKETWSSYLNDDDHDLFGRGDVTAAGEEVNGEQIIVVCSWSSIPKLNAAVAGLLGGTTRAASEFKHYIHVACDDIGKEDGDEAADARAIRAHLETLKDEDGTPLLCKEALNDLTDSAEFDGESAYWTDEEVCQAIFFGAEIGFSDEYNECYECHKIIHTSPESYGDIGRYFQDPEDGSYTCRDCIQKNPERFIEIAAESDQPMNCPVDPRGHGFAAVRSKYSVANDWNQKREHSFEHGWYGGQIDNPGKQKQFLLKCQIKPVLFDVSPSQFQTSWNILVKAPDQTVAEQVLLSEKGEVFFWRYNKSTIILFFDMEAAEATLHIRWDNEDDPEQQIECTRKFTEEEVPSDLNRILSWLVNEAFIECVKANSFSEDEDDWMRELLVGYVSNQWRWDKPAEFFRDVTEKRDPKDALAEGLKAAAAIPRPEDPNMVHIVSVHADGTATAHPKTKEEFIRGTAD